MILYLYERKHARGREPLVDTLSYFFILPNYVFPHFPVVDHRAFPPRIPRAAQVTFTAVVTAPSYQGTPTGTVTFTIDGRAQTPVALAVVGGQDEAQFTALSLLAGSHTVVATYSGDSNVSGSTGSLLTETVNQAPVNPPPVNPHGSPSTTATTLASSSIR